MNTGAPFAAQFHSRSADPWVTCAAFAGRFVDVGRPDGPGEDPLNVDPSVSEEAFGSLPESERRGFANASRPWPWCGDGVIRRSVTPRMVIIRLLSIDAAIGILFAPMVTPSARAFAAMTMDGATDASPAAMSRAGMDMMVGMPAEAAPMDCCPPHTPPRPECPKDCPWATLCVAKCFPNMAAVLGEQALMPSWLPAVIPSGRGCHRDLLPEPPPPRPPRA